MLKTLILFCTFEPQISGRAFSTFSSWGVVPPGTTPRYHGGSLKVIPPERCNFELVIVTGSISSYLSLVDSPEVLKLYKYIFDIQRLVDPQF